MMLKLPDSSTQRTSAKQMRWKAFYSGMRPVDAPCRWKAAFPVLSAASKDDRLERAVPKAKNLRGKWETLARCGLVFSNAESVKYIIADGHGSHLWLRQLLLGQKISLADDLLQELPFRGKLVAEDLPLVCIPLPWRIVRMDGESIHFIPGQVVKYHEICRNILNHMEQQVFEGIRRCFKWFVFLCFFPSCRPSAHSKELL